MKKESTIRVQAKNLEAALAEAATTLGVKKELVGYEVISQTHGGFFSLFGGKHVEISAWRLNDNRHFKKTSRREKFDEERDEHKQRQYHEVQELTSQQLQQLKTELQEFCQNICGHISGHHDVKVKLIEKDDRLVFDINDQMLETQLGKNSKLAEAIEHLMRKKPRHIKRDLPFHVFVDANGVRLKREQELIQMALDLSEKVHQNQRPIVLNYRNPSDRKIIHLALDEDRRVYTKSVGSGANRRLMILPARGYEKYEDRESKTPEESQQ